MENKFSVWNQVENKFSVWIDDNVAFIDDVDWPTAQRITRQLLALGLADNAWAEIAQDIFVAEAPVKPKTNRRTYVGSHRRD